MSEYSDALKLLREVRDDRESGASQLLVKTLKAIRMLCAAEPSKTVLEEALNIIKESHPPMTPLRMLERIMEWLIRRFTLEEAAKRLDRISARLLEYRGECLEEAYTVTSDLIRGGIIFTLSYSSTVYSAILHLKSKPEEVIVAESMPGGEGRKLSEELKAKGIRSMVIPDSAMARAIKRSHAILLGADTMTREGGVVNKLGSYTAALIAKSLRKRVYVLLEPYKIAPWWRRGEEIPAIQWRADTPPLFEYVPPELIDYAIICGRVVKPTEEEVVRVYMSFLESLEAKDILEYYNILT